MSTLAKHTPGTPAWFDLMTSDRAGAVAFYEALFGWHITDSGPEYGHYGMCQVRGANAAGLGQIPPGAGFPPSWSVYFAVESADATADAIKAAGGQVMQGPFDVGQAGRMAIAADPTGAVFGLWQPMEHQGASIVNEPGAMTWCEVNTRDAAAAKAFYETVFGLEGRRMEMPQTTYFTLHKGDTTAAGVLQMTDAWEGIPPCWTAYFAVADIDASVTRIPAIGGAVLHGPFDTPYGRMAVVKDPQGATFAIIQLTQPG